MYTAVRNPTVENSDTLIDNVINDLITNIFLKALFTTKFSNIILA